MIKLKSKIEASVYKIMLIWKRLSVFSVPDFNHLLSLEFYEILIFIIVMYVPDEHFAVLPTNTGWKGVQV